MSAQMAYSLVLIVAALVSASMAVNWRDALADDTAMNIFTKIHSGLYGSLGVDEVRESLKEFLDMCNSCRGERCTKVEMEALTELKASVVNEFKCSLDDFDARYQLVKQRAGSGSNIVAYLDFYYWQQLAACENTTVVKFLRTMNNIPAKTQGQVSELLERVIKARKPDPVTGKGQQPNQMSATSIILEVTQKSLADAMRAYYKAHPDLLFTRSHNWSNVVDSIVNTCEDYGKYYAPFDTVFRRCLWSESCLSRLQPNVVRRLNEFRVCQRLVHEVKANEEIKALTERQSAARAKQPEQVTTNKPKFWKKKWPIN